MMKTAALLAVLLFASVADAQLYTASTGYTGYSTSVAMVTVIDPLTGLPMAVDAPAGYVYYYNSSPSYFWYGSTWHPYYNGSFWHPNYFVNGRFGGRYYGGRYVGPHYRR